MDKQKQIEEMVGDIAKALSGVLVSEIVNLAYFLDEQGYRKIPENAVVLTREEYEWLTCCFGKFEEIMNDIKKLARKETAEKLLDKVDYESNGQTKQITDLLRKEFGVEKSD